jgi:hypothetical protein
MSTSFSKLNVLLGKVQSALGTKQSSLAYGDFRTVDDNFELTYAQEFGEQNLAQGFFGQPQSVLGMASVDVKVGMPIIPTGSSTTPNVHNFLQCSGLSYALATSKHTYAPTSDIATYWKDMTLWGYTGDLTAGESLLTKAHSVMYDLELVGELGKPMQANFAGKGVPDGAPAAASYVSGTLAVLSSIVPAVIKSTTLAIGGINYSILKFSVKLGNDVQLIKAMSDNSGNLQSMIVGRKSTWTATVYQETLSTKNPYTVMNAQTLGSFTATFGTAGSRITIAADASKAEITDIKGGNDNGLNTFEMSGNFIDNGWSMAINDA